MAGRFACPGCGQRLSLRGLAPGRLVRCPRCSERVEVPYLPRATSPEGPAPDLLGLDDEADLGGGAAVGSTLSGRRDRFRRPIWRSPRVWAAASVALIALMTFLAIRAIGGRARSIQEDALASLVRSAEAAEASGRLGEAFREYDAALGQARKIDPEGSNRVDTIRIHRDHASVNDVLARLRGVEALDPDRALGEARTLEARARADDALASIRHQVGVVVEAAAVRQAEADLRAARAALDAGRGSESFALADRAGTRAGKLGDPNRDRLGGEARRLVESAVGRFGVEVESDVKVEPPPGNLPGPATPRPGVEGRVVVPFVEALQARGYLVRPKDADAWKPTWLDRAPYRATIKGREGDAGPYLQSSNRATEVDATYVLTRKGQVTWQARVVGRTRAPIPDLPAFLAGHLATAPRRDPEIETRLREDALAAFKVQTDRQFRPIPAPEGPEVDP